MFFLYLQNTLFSERNRFEKIDENQDLKSNYGSETVYFYEGKDDRFKLHSGSEQTSNDSKSYSRRLNGSFYNRFEKRSPSVSTKKGSYLKNDISGTNEDHKLGFNINRNETNSFLYSHSGKNSNVNATTNSSIYTMSNKLEPPASILPYWGDVTDIDERSNRDSYKKICYSESNTEILKPLSYKWG
ncbi:hypothetical protein AYI69_g11250 [Smittium culicis]|uniref:Uncharacterized protein n=1 Tax=Smittium culicis TaxID=133412 RepID=A0A1R1X004_9FUNG|nr:hypothetical protein AYI69_g11250 [Smittium culicis]